jgi:hypothetical protein
MSLWHGTITERPFPFSFPSLETERLFGWQILAYLDLPWLISSYRILFILPAEHPLAVATVLGLRIGFSDKNMIHDNNEKMHTTLSIFLCLK